MFMPKPRTTPHPAPTSDAELAGWFAGRLPDGWFTGAPEVRADREEILVIGSLADPVVGDDADDATRTAAAEAKISGFREDTRDQRMRIADEAEQRFARKVAWGARCRDDGVVFTHLAVPVMTRLRMGERLSLIHI